MSVLDIIIVVLMIFLVVRGIMRGFVGAVASLAGVVLGGWFAIRYMTRITELLRPQFPDLSILPIISFALIVLTVFILCNLAAWGLKLLLKKTSLSVLDRALGGGLGLLTGIVITYFLIVVLTMYLPQGSPFMVQSKLSPVVISSFQAIKNTVVPVLSKEWKEKSALRKGPDTGGGKVDKKKSL